ARPLSSSRPRPGSASSLGGTRPAPLERTAGRARRSPCPLSRLTRFTAVRPAHLTTHQIWQAWRDSTPHPPDLASGALAVRATRLLVRPYAPPSTLYAPR